IIENEPQSGNTQEKHCRLDLNCKLNDGKLANVEMTMDATSFEFIRIEYYAAKLFGGSNTTGLSYENFPDVYQISIIGNRNLIKDKKEIINFYEICNLRTKEPINGKIHIITAELGKIKYNKKSIEEMDSKERWSLFFAWFDDKTKLDKINKIISLEEGIAMATNVLRNITDDELIRMELISKYKREEDWKNQLATIKSEERKEGREEGERKGKIEIARNLLEEGFATEQITRITGLTIEEIKTLKNQN
ncbi:MAG: Rpn family recombination-promoting nuclease/putative transposase, partial [Clostridiales bacterium]|nr:Rpn family recombination-promoting nuclease/putative transposase [Clostridiales bacterium]